LWILQLGYGWLAVGFILLAINCLVPLLPSTTALHALTSRSSRQARANLNREHCRIDGEHNPKVRPNARN